jgi:hypothetical protein
MTRKTANGSGLKSLGGFSLAPTPDPRRELVFIPCTFSEARSTSRQCVFVVKHVYTVHVTVVVLFRHLFTFRSSFITQQL